MAEEHPQDYPATEDTPLNAKQADIPSVYSNNTRILAGFYDIRFTFADTIITGEKQGTIVPQVTVVMSPEHAKALAETLANSLERYERQFGQIRIRPQNRE